MANENERPGPRFSTRFAQIGIVAVLGLAFGAAATTSRADERALLAYVGSYSNGVSIVDLQSGARVDHLERLAYGRVFGATLSPDGRHLYLAYIDDDRVVVLDTRTRQVVRTISTSGAPAQMAITADGRWLYVVAVSGNALDIVDTMTGEVVASVGVREHPNDVTLSPDERFAFVAGSGLVPERGDASVIDTMSHALAQVFDIIPYNAALTVAASPRGDFLYAGFPRVPIAVLDAQTGAMITTIDSGASIVQIRFSLDGTHALALGQGPESVWIETQQHTVERRIPVGGWKMAFSPDGRRAYIASFFSIAVVDLESGRVVGEHADVGEPLSIAVGPRPCEGDCDGDDTVTTDELIVAVQLALGQPSRRCVALDIDGSGSIAISEVIGGVRNLLEGCQL